MSSTWASTKSSSRDTWQFTKGITTQHSTARQRDYTKLLQTAPCLGLNSQPKQIHNKQAELDKPCSTDQDDV
jgi:hypothetical protein